MPTTDGVFVLDAQPPHEDDGVMKQRINLMFVFATEPVDIGSAIRVKLTPAHRDGDPNNEWVLPEAARILMPAAAPQVITALNQGEAIYQVIGVSLNYPIDVVSELPTIEAMWRTMSDQGQRVIAKERFQFAGAWVEFAPTP